VLIHPKLGQKKPGDYTDAAILAGYEALLEHYYPAGVVALSTFTSRMWYAGPREAVFDAIVRKNHGCTHFIVGRDHAGVGDYYGDFAAQALLERFAHIGIAPITFDYAFHCAECDGIVSEKVCPHDPSAWVVPSGTAIREVLAERRRPVPELMRPEVADRILKSGIRWRTSTATTSGGRCIRIWGSPAPIGARTTAGRRTSRSCSTATASL
jgi:sulfate adenylyltransferase